jgi:type I pantothenate kinase
MGAPDAQNDSPIAEVAGLLLSRRSGPGAFIVGVTGGVAAGKTTFSAGLEASLRSATPLRIERVSTDGFLFANAVLAERGLSMRKGFPESYDAAALARSLAEVRAGAADFPGYSHITYDVDPALTRRIEGPDILIVEGVALPTTATGARALLDLVIYLDAAEASLEAWYVGRFLRFWAEARNEPASFYARFGHLARHEADRLARAVWREINLPLLRQCVRPLKTTADIVVHKRADHRIDRISSPRVHRA